MGGSVKCFDETKYMSYLIGDEEELLKAYNKLWDKLSNIMQKGFDSEPVYNGKYLKTKIKSYKGKINTNFHDNGVSKGSLSLRLFISNISRLRFEEG